MNDLRNEDLDQYYADAESWSADRQRSADRSRRIAWIVAGVAALIALVEAFALFLLIPLKREVPYTLLVDRQTGYVEALEPLEPGRVTADSALTRSFLVQYVIARESFDADTLQENYRKVGLMSGGEARERYLAQMQSGTPGNPFSVLSRRATVDVRVRSVSSLSADTAMVRFDTIQTDPGGQPQLSQNWAAVIRYRYSDAEMGAADRLVNPMGFQVVRYRKDPETLPEAEPAAVRPDPVRPTRAGPEQEEEPAQ
jgi:type IV secretion system protein VirB8